MTPRSGVTLESPPPPPAPDLILERVATFCDAVVNHLTLTHDPNPRPQSAIPTCRGYDDRQSVPDYLNRLEVYNAAVGVSKAYMLNPVLRQALRGSAACWWRLQSQFQSRDAFRQRFREEFLPPRYESRTLRELDLRSQHPNKSLLEYVPAMQESLLHGLQYLPPLPRHTALEPSCAWGGPEAHERHPADRPVTRAPDPHTFARTAAYLQQHHPPGSNNRLVGTQQASAAHAPQDVDLDAALNLLRRLRPHLLR
ncbi:hypothetical protein HPB47_007679 [Ixodes persulcatus]|uniref:Uncharacterized protein n=1 Tax=Ixodes persulcatus TaxID=34615 RepID=A0AC60P6T8_IXOPE|nr:hypothetical protein HPB47_007679 [Ixodes persulcatus]